MGTIHLGCQQSIKEIDLSREDPYSKNNPIESRAWTLEEKLLSRRMLIYSSTNLLWICKSKTSFNGGDWDFRPGPRIMSIDENVKSQGRKWREIIEDYSQRSMSNERDKLRAISGLAKKCMIRYPDQYLAGLWQSEMTRDLLWRVQGKQERAISISTLLTAPSNILQSHRQIISVSVRSAPYRAPTWSWASVNTPVTWRNYPNFSKHKDFEIVGCSVTPVSVEEPYGEVAQAHLRVRGPLVRLGSEQDLLNTTSHIACHFEDSIASANKEIYGLIIGQYIGGV